MRLPRTGQAARSRAGSSSTTAVVCRLLGVKSATTVAASTMHAPAKSARWYPWVDAWASVLQFLFRPMIQKLWVKYLATLKSQLEAA